MAPRGFVIATLLALAAPGALGARVGVPRAHVSKVLSGLGRGLTGDAEQHLVSTSRTRKEDVLTDLQEALLSQEGVLFVIIKSDNENTVIYETKDGGPVVAYWRDFAKGPEGPRDELSWMGKKMAYGITQEKGASSFTVAALPNMPIALVTHGDALRAEVSFGGKTLVLHHLYAKTTSSWGMPSVSYINVHGVEASGDAVCLKVDTSGNVQGDC